MKKAIVALLVLTAACQSSHTYQTGTGNGDGLSATPGAPSSTVAAERFLDAVRAKNLYAMSLIWGTSKGPVRDTMDPNELEKREMIIQCFYNHDKFRILSDLPGDAGTKGSRVVKVELTRGKDTRQPSLIVVKGPSDRWYVQELDMKTMAGFCH